MITLISTGHYETGLCSSQELLKLIESINPDVIFEEVPQNKFDLIYNGLLSDSLETLAVKAYLKNSQIPHFPVDLELEKLKEEMIRRSALGIFSYFERLHERYRAISGEHERLSAELGFPYLSSNKCSEILNEKRQLEHKIVKEANDFQLTQDYDAWQVFLDSRRNTMVEGVLLHYKQLKFRNGLILVGAEHRSSLKEKLTQEGQDLDKGLVWNFNYFE